MGQRAQLTASGCPTAELLQLQSDRRALQGRIIWLPDRRPQITRVDVRNRGGPSYKYVRTFLKTRAAGRIVLAMIIAVGVNTDGWREVLVSPRSGSLEGLPALAGRSLPVWRQLVKGLARRRRRSSTPP